MDTTSFFRYPTPLVEDRGAASGFLDRVGARDWDTLLASMQTLSLRAGDTAFTEERPDRALYLLTAGRLEVSAAGMVPVIVEGPPAEVLNDVAFLDGGRCTATARAITDGRLLRLSHDTFEALAARQPQLACRVALDLGRMVAQRLRHSSAPHS